MCISQNNLYNMHHTMDFLQKPVTYSKVSIYINEHISAIRMKSPCVIVHKQVVKMLCQVINATVHSVSITWCKLWQQFGGQLLYWNAEGCTPYVCLIFISKVQIYTSLWDTSLWDTDWKNFEMFELVVLSRFVAFLRPGQIRNDIFKTSCSTSTSSSHLCSS